MRQLSTAGWIGLILALQTGCSSSAPVVEDTLGRTAPLPILRDQSGSDPDLTEPGQWLINSQQQLDAIGSQELARLAVDFDTESLVLIALGRQSTDGYWIKILGASQVDDELYIQGVANQPTEGSITGQTLTYPYGAAVIAKTSAGVLHPEMEAIKDQVAWGSNQDDP